MSAVPDSTRDRGSDGVPIKLGLADGKGSQHIPDLER